MAKSNQKQNRQAKNDMNIIKSFDSVNRLYRRGVNICKGCERENAASCTKAHFCTCNQQAARYIQAIKIVTTYNV